MGIRTIWVIDPETRRAQIFGENPEFDLAYLKVAGSPAYVDPDQILARLNKYQPTTLQVPEP